MKKIGLREEKILNFLEKYPKTKKFLKLHPEMSLDEALKYTEKQIMLREGKHYGKQE